MASYDFRLPDIRVTVTAGRGEFTAEVIDATGQVIGKGRDHSEPGALGLAILAARRAFVQCESCGRLCYPDEVEQVLGGPRCGDCTGAL